MSDQEQCRLKVLIEALQQNEIGLNDYRRKMLDRTPEPNDWAAFTYRIEPEELIWAAAATGDSFALLRGEDIDVLLHGQNDSCNVSGLLLDMLGRQKLHLVAKCCPGELVPDRY